MITKSAVTLSRLGDMVRGHIRSVVGAGYNAGRYANAAATTTANVGGKLYNNTVGPVLRAAGRGSLYLAKNHPKKALLAGALSAAAAVRFSDLARKNLVHTDTGQDLTQQNMTSIGYNDPYSAAEARNQNLFY